MAMCNTLTTSANVVSTAVASMCQSSSVMSVNPANVENCVFFGTPCGVSFFAFSRFIGFAFRSFYFYFSFIQSQLRTSRC